MPTRIQLARKEIVSFFDGFEKKLFRAKELQSIFYHNHGEWRLAASMKFKDFVSYLVKNTELKRHVLEFPKIETVTFSWGDVSVFELALAVSSEAYLSHYTAAFLHELTNDVPKTVYVTSPQPSKRAGDIKLTQDQIDRAFAREPRPTNNIAKVGKNRIALLTGMDTGGLGITSLDSDDYGLLRITSIERTMIDLVVKPIYAGGVNKVLESFRIAAGRVSTNKMLAMIKNLPFVYPYHQALGFYMERSEAFTESALRLVKSMPIDRDFYLTHGMEDKDFDPNWRVYFPKGM